MKRFIISFSLIFILFFIGCKSNTNEDNNYNSNYENVKTSKVLLKGNAPAVTYTFIDQEGEIYKTGTVYPGETITINHFKNGIYNVHSKDSMHTTITVKTIEISENCTITFITNGDFSITK